MKRALVALTLLVASSALGQNVSWVPDLEPESAVLGWERRIFDSRIVGGPVGYYLYLPPGYADHPDERYPVVYWLHGLGGSPASARAVVERLPRAIEKGVTPPFILVSCTDSTSSSMWTDSKDGKVPVESVIVDELVPHVDATHRTVADRSARAIEGFSMGGYGAAYLGFKYPETFGVISMLAGALHTAESLKNNRRSIFDAVHGGDLERAETYSPWSVVVASAASVRGRTTVRMFVGSKDGLLERNERYHALLTELDIEHEWGVVPEAPHDSEILLRNWPDGDPFAFYAKAFGALAAP